MLTFKTVRLESLDMMNNDDTVDRLRATVAASPDNATRIQGAEWHLFQGAQEELLQFLTENGISYVLH